MQKLLQDISFGKNLQKLRKARKLSQYDIVREFELRGRGMTRANYAHIEQGIRNLYISDLILLKEILNVSYDDFFEGLSAEDHFAEAENREKDQ